METNTVTNTSKQRKPIRRSKLILVAVVSFVIVVLCSVAGAAAITLSSDKIYSGVCIDGTDVGKMSTEQARIALCERYQADEQKELQFTFREIKCAVPVSALSPEIQIDDAVSEAHRFGREGSVIQRLCDIWFSHKPHEISLHVKLDQEALAEAIAPISGQVDQPEQDNQFQITENELIITRGHSGRRIILEHVEQLAAERILKNDSTPLALSLETVNPQEITVAYIENEVCGAPENASYRVENRRLVMIDEKIGVTMNRSDAKKAIEESSGDTIRIPIVTQQPELTAKQLQASLFTDCLGTYTTNYNAGDAGRSYNISLASQHVNEVVLAPGDVFSYNDIVGPRTAERGFRTAHVYVGNKVEDGLGGGICQVSSTLYNAVVLSDLKIVTRTNHSLPVSYVPMGRDATVSYGSIDFKFENNTSHPIKIAASAGGGKNTIAVYGTQEHPGRSISIETERTATYPAKLEQKKDPELFEGETKVEQKGSDGSSYNSYKIVKQDGAVVSRDLLAKSTYVSVDRIEFIGTKPKEETPSPDAEPTAETTAETDIPTEIPQENSEE